MSESLRLRSLLAMGVSAAAVLGLAAPAYAQDATPTANTPTTVGEVVVTAQKREEAIQDVPIAVSAFSQDTLEKAKIDGGPNLVIAIPNVNFSKGNFTTYNFQIRGVGSKLVSASGDSAVGIHLNNGPLTANNLFEAEFYDVERVEVLRGPQGTLYGRNATGGVVNMITAKPVNDFEAMVRAEVGNFDTRKFRGMVNIPLGEMFALRLAGTTLQRSGYSENVVTGNDVDDRDIKAYRATLSFDPTESISTYLLYDHFEEDDNRSRIGKQYCTPDPGPTSVGGVPISSIGPIAAVQRGLLSQGCLPSSVSDPSALGVANSVATFPGLLGVFTGLMSGDVFAGKRQDPDPRVIEAAFDPIYQAESDIWQFNLSWDLTDALQFTALTSYAETSLFTMTDLNRTRPNITFNATPGPVNAFAGPLAAAYVAGAQALTCGVNPAAPGYSLCLAAVAADSGVQTAAANYYASTVFPAVFPGGVVNDPQMGPSNVFQARDISSGESEQWTQELRLQSNFDGPINFNVGGIYLDYKADGHYFVFTNTGTAFYGLQNFLNPNVGEFFCDPSNPQCIFIDPSPIPTGEGRQYFDSRQPYHLKSRAAFGELYWQATDALKFTLGLRYTHDRKLATNYPSQLGLPGVGPAYGDPPVQLADFKETTGRLGFDWKPVLGFTDETLVYAFYSKGYKGGGINPPCTAAVGCLEPTFAPEFVNSIEVGTKNTLLNGSLVLNVTGFMYDYEGYQISKIVNRTSANENIDAKIKGLELETVWSPIRPLRLNAAIGWLETEIQGGESVDPLNATGGDPALTLIKSAQAANCVVPTAALAGFMALFNAGTPVIPEGSGARAIAITDFLGACSGALAPFGITPSDGVNVHLEGKELPNSPHWTTSFGAEYTFEMGDWSARLRGDYYRQSESYSRIFNTNADRLDSWQNVNATLTVSNDLMGLEVEAYVKNATDEEAVTDVFLQDASVGLFRNAFYVEPRTYGVAVTKRW